MKSFIRREPKTLEEISNARTLVASQQKNHQVDTVSKQGKDYRNATAESRI